MKFIAALILSFTATRASAEEIFLESRHEHSKRIAVFEDDERVAYLYLTKPRTQRPERDAIVYTRLAPGAGAIQEKGSTPLLTQDLASETARIEKPDAREFSFSWSSDGNAVAILRNGIPMAFTAASEKFGYSKAVSKSSKLVNAWDQARYDALFAGVAQPRR